MYSVTEYQYQQLRNRYPQDEVIKEIGRQPQPQDSKKETAEEVAKEIAKEHIGIGDLTGVNSDERDFHTVSSWSLKRALEAAYNRGAK